MRSDNGLLVDLGEVLRAVEEADVFVVGFSNMSERLLVDARCDSRTGPLVRVVEPMASVEERLLWLGHERGEFGQPQAFTFVLWPHSVPFLVESGIWQRIRRRTQAGRYAGSARQCDATLEDLLALERYASNAAVRGEGFVTLWPRATRT